MHGSFLRRLLFLIILSCLFLITALIPEVSTAQTLHPYLLVASNSDPGRVLRYDGLTGAFVDAFVPTASGGLRFTIGMAVAVGGDGNLYITNDSGTNTGGVWRYSGTTGAFMGAFVPLGSGGPG
jgi:TctA family transporter